METLRLKQMERAYRKVYRIMETDERDPSWRRLGSFKELYSQGHKRNHHTVHPFRTIDYFFLVSRGMAHFQNVSRVCGRWR